MSLDSRMVSSIPKHHTGREQWIAENIIPPEYRSPAISKALGSTQLLGIEGSTWTAGMDGGSGGTGDQDGGMRDTEDDPYEGQQGRGGSRKEMYYSDNIVMAFRY
jgi:hypothetical protein